LNKNLQLMVMGDGGPCIYFDGTWLMQSVATTLILFHGKPMFATRAAAPRGCSYKTFARGFHAPTGTLLLYSREYGLYTSGWWHNPDYNRCRHLSLSFHETNFESEHYGGMRQCLPKDAKITEKWIDCFFGAQKKLLWCEPPMTDHGKKFDVWHYRLFCDEHWNPIKPRGEVCSCEFTETGWKSYSDVRHDRMKALEDLTNAGND
jgi:hypothetical protein